MKIKTVIIAVILSLQFIAQSQGFTDYEAHQCHEGMTLRQICVILDMPATDCAEDSTGRICFFISGARILECFFKPGNERATNVTYLSN
jgi:hypothetical protein